MVKVRIFFFRSSGLDIIHTFILFCLFDSLHIVWIQPLFYSIIHRIILSCMRINYMSYYSVMMLLL